LLPETRGRTLESLDAVPVPEPTLAPLPERP